MILYRYIIREHIFPFLASLSIIVFLFLMQWAAQLLDRIISKGLDPGVVLEIFVIQLGWIIALAIPMAILTATLMTFGRMAGDNEITAIKASGRSMWPALIPVLSAALIMMVLLIYFNNDILPDANHRAANLLSDISRKRPAAFIEPGVLIRNFPDYTIYTNAVNARSGELKGIKIFCNGPGKDPSTTVAARGFIRFTSDQRFLELTLYDGETHSTSRQDPASYFVGRFKRQVVFIENPDTKLQRTNSTYRSDREKSSARMLKDVQELKQSQAVLLKEFNGSLDTLCAQISRLDTSREVAVARIDSSMTFANWAYRLRTSQYAALNQTRTQEEYADRLLKRIEADAMMISQYMVEVHKKYAIPVACIIFVLIGAPLGIMARRGGLTVGTTYSIFFFITYWAFLIGGEALADKMVVSPEVAMWSGNVLIGLCGFVLIILMLRETTIRFDFITARWGKFTQWNKGRMQRIASTRAVRIVRLPLLITRLPSYLVRTVIGTLPTYLIRLFMGYLSGVLLSIIAVYTVVDYISNLKRFENATFFEVILYYWYYLPWIIQTVLPIVLLLASMFAIGRLAKHSELTAMKASGVNIRQLTAPLLVLGILLSVISFYAGEQVIPNANMLRRELDERLNAGGTKVAAAVLGREYRRDFYYFGNPQTIYNFQEFVTNPQSARGVRREIFSGNSITQRITAEQMIYDRSGWHFYKGQERFFDRDSSRVLNFDTLKDTILNVAPLDMVAQVKSEEEMSYWELRKTIDLARRRGEQVGKYAAELDFKIALPVMNWIVILLGIAITARAGRKGSAVLFGIGLLLTFSYWLIARFAIVFAENGHLPSIVGAWLGNVLFLIIGLLLYRKAAQ